jgi:hypothetical protein
MISVEVGPELIDCEMGESGLEEISRIIVGARGYREPFKGQERGSLKTGRPQAKRLELAEDGLPF